VERHADAIFRPARARGEPPTVGYI